MPSFQELSDQLGKVLSDLSNKKDALNKAIDIVGKAQADYNNSVAYAQDIKKQMSDLLNDAIPTTSTDKIRA